MKPIVILLDVGNTSVTYGIYRGGRFQVCGSALLINIPNIIKKCVKSGMSKSYYVVISSVVPKSTLFLKKALKPLVSRILLAGKDIPVAVRHNYQPKHKLGIDRLVNLYGAARIYKKRPLLVIDFGTATTFDLLDKKSRFAGGMIIPGPEISFQTLLSRAALIPKSFRLPRKAKGFLGNSTYDCMSSGILEGYGAMTDELIRRFKRHYGNSLQVIATGGFAPYLLPYSSALKSVDLNHSIKSLLILYKSHRMASGQ